MNYEKIIIASDNYDYIDGRNAYDSKIKKLTIGAPKLEANANMEIAAQVWAEGEDGELEMSYEVPIHQIYDLMILLSRTLLHFKEAYRLPLLYNPEQRIIERVGVQGGALPVEVCVDNPNIDEDIKSFSQSLSDLGELTGERQRTLTRILNELELY